jgi:predicted nuclease of predicted toxin-antitoxin system
MHTIRFLLDENISHETATFFHGLGYETMTVAQLHLEQTDDELIAQYAHANHYTIISLDLDFGYLFQFRFPNELGLIILRLENQTIESVNMTLARVLSDPSFLNEKNRYTLIVADEKRIRVHHVS